MQSCKRTIDALVASPVVSKPLRKSHSSKTTDEFPPVTVDVNPECFQCRIKSHPMLLRHAYEIMKEAVGQVEVDTDGNVVSQHLINDYGLVIDLCWCIARCMIAEAACRWRAEDSFLPYGRYFARS